MSNNIIGFSHLVFTVGHQGESKLPGSSFLKNHYLDSEYFELDHSQFRTPMIRDEKNAISRISLFKSKDNDLPAVELLHSNSSIKRPLENFGVICRSNDPEIEQQELKALRFSGTDFFVRYYYDDVLSSYIGIETNFFDTSKEQGCWIRLKDFDTQKSFFKSIASAKTILETGELLIIKCRVINKKLSSFVFVLIKDTEPVDSVYYNDDYGLSTLGWFVRNLENLAGPDTKTSDLFSILLNGNNFNARFIYNNKNISHELLKIN